MYNCNDKIHLNDVLKEAIMARKANPDKIKIQVTISKQMKAFYDDYADSIGQTTSGVIAMFLKMNMDGLQIASKSNDLKEIIQEVIVKQNKADTGN